MIKEIIKSLEKSLIRAEDAYFKSGITEIQKEDLRFEIVSLRDQIAYLKKLDV